MRRLVNGSMPMSRREILALGGAATAGALVAASPLGGGLASASSLGAAPAATGFSADPLPTKEIEEALQAQGSMANGVFPVEIEREDLAHARVDGTIPFKPAWENNGDFVFQSLGGGMAMLNGDFGGLLPSEVNPFIDQLLAHGLVFQALHQHFMVTEPRLFFIHFRGVGDPVALAKAGHAAVKVTDTPLPQTMPAHPTTPLDAARLGRIIGGPATVGGAGTVTVLVPRANPMMLGGHRINPFLNVETNIIFEPLPGAGHTAVAPDFAMVASEVDRVMRVMRSQGWMVNCLYNQETDEEPQLFFSHQLKVGNAYELAAEVRRGLDQTNSRFTS